MTDAEDIANLSGWLDSRVTSLEGQILALPTNSDITNFTNLLAGRLNTLETTDSSQTDNITLLLQSFSYLKDTILGIETNLTNHTGLYTGDGAHQY